jgi:hypothetical protein
MLAEDGRCKALDAAADGYVRAEAAGMLLLVPTAAAAASGTTPLALLAGSAVNQDGRSSGLTAPNGPAQQALMRAALADAGLSPAAVGLLELHGTGTPLGDPIEVGAATAVLLQPGGGKAGGASAAGAGGTPWRTPLLVSAVKSQLGHAEPAAGVVGVLRLQAQVRGRGNVWSKMCTLLALTEATRVLHLQPRTTPLPGNPAAFARLPHSPLPRSPRAPRRPSSTCAPSTPTSTPPWAAPLPRRARTWRARRCRGPTPSAPQCAPVASARSPSR